MNINEVVKFAQDEWMNISGVIGVGTSKKGGRDAMLVIVESFSPLIEASIPSKFYGYEVIFYKSKPATIQMM